MVIMVNVDKAMREQANLGVFGVVFRDCRGTLLDATSLGSLMLEQTI